VNAPDLGQILPPSSSARMSPSAECGDITMFAGRAAQEEESERDLARGSGVVSRSMSPRGYALTLPHCDDDAKSAFASCGHAAAWLWAAMCPRVIAAVRRTGLTGYLAGTARITPP
jgi:hypothetical protein